MIGSDYNFDFMRIDQHANTRILLDMFIAHGFFPTNTLPSRITNTTQTLIDNIFLKIGNYDVLKSGLLTTQISDHLPVFLLIGKLDISGLNLQYFTLPIISGLGCPSF